jgi:hypothetical protein
MSRILLGFGKASRYSLGSHYKIVIHLISLYPSVQKVLIKVGNDRS